MINQQPTQAQTDLNPFFPEFTDTRIGLNKGHAVTAIPKKSKPSHRKGKSTDKHKFVKSVIREVVGFAPYERRVLELLRNGKVSYNLVEYI